MGAKKGPLGMACDRAHCLAQRHATMQAWAGDLDPLDDGAQVIPLKPRAA